MEYNYENINNILGTTVNLVKSNAESTAVILQRIETTEQLVGGIVKKVTDHGDIILNIKDRMAELELNEEISEEQANNIKTTVNKRIAEILHFNEDEIAKYFRTFVIKCYSSLKKEHHMGSSYRSTHKKYYQSLLDTIEAWTPSEGVQKLKDKIDKRAEAKRNARKNGYDE